MAMSCFLRIILATGQSNDAERITVPPVVKATGQKDQEK